jgi:hypothetical protein
MQNESYKFSDGQTLSNLDSTGEISSNTWDLEANAMVDDMVMGNVIITIISAPAQATIAGTEGVFFEVRTAAAVALTSSYEVIGAISVLPAKLVAGAQFTVPVFTPKAQKQMGVWYRDVSTDVVGDIVVDADFQYSPVVTSEDIQIKRTSI